MDDNFPDFCVTVDGLEYIYYDGLKPDINLFLILTLLKINILVNIKNNGLTEMDLFGVLVDSLN